jgi:hypothetical protein
LVVLHEHSHRADVLKLDKLKWFRKALLSSSEMRRGRVQFLGSQAVDSPPLLEG